MIIADGISSTNPKALPSAQVQYTITNNQDSPDSNSVIIEDTLLDDVDLFVGDFASGAPYNFIEASPGCGFTVPFVSLASVSDAIEFRDVDGNIITPSPDTDGYDPNVRSISLVPTGQLVPFSGSGSQPSCSLIFLVRIRGN